MAIMKQYKQGDLPENMYGNEASKQGDSKINVVKPGAGLPADYAEGGVNKDFPKENKNNLCCSIFFIYWSNRALLFKFNQTTWKFLWLFI